MPRVEIDRHFEPAPMSEVRKKFRYCFADRTE